LQLLLHLLEQDEVLLLLQHVTAWQVLQLLQLSELLLKTGEAWLLLLLNAPQVLWVLLTLHVLLLLVLHLDLLDLLHQSVDQLLVLLLLDNIDNLGRLLLLLNGGQNLKQLLEQGLELLVLRLVLLDEVVWHLLSDWLTLLVVEVLFVIGNDLA
jgi:hypothetical protein